MGLIPTVQTTRPHATVPPDARRTHPSLHLVSHWHHSQFPLCESAQALQGQRVSRGLPEKQMQRKTHGCIRTHKVGSQWAATESLRQWVESVCTPEAEGPAQGLELTAVPLRVRIRRPVGPPRRAGEPGQKPNSLCHKPGEDGQAEGKAGAPGKNQQCVSSCPFSLQQPPHRGWGSFTPHHLLPSLCSDCGCLQRRTLASAESLS